MSSSRLLVPLALAAAFGLPATARTQQPVRESARADSSRADTLRADSARRSAARAERRAAQDAERAERDAERARRDADRETIPLDELGTTIGTALREGLRTAADALRGVDGQVGAASYAAATVARGVATEVGVAVSEAMRDVADAVGRDEPDARRAVRGGQPVSRIDTTVATGATPDVELSLVSGPITVTTWDRPEVRVRGESERIPMYFEHRGDRVRVWLERGDRSRRNAGDQRLEVTVPAGTMLEASSVSGSVRIVGVRGEVKANTVSGGVELQDGGKLAQLSTVSGDVRALRAGDDVRASTVSGDVLVEDAGNAVEANTVSGDVTVRRAPRARRVRAQVLSGTLAYEGAILRDGRYEFTSHSGAVRLVMPADAGATLALRTFSGRIDTAFPITLQPGPDGMTRSFGGGDRRLEFTLGTGGARVTAETFSGSIVLARAGDPAPR